ncbi:YegP family protein [Haladaptatus halobius]
MDSGEEYRSKQGAKRGIESVKKNASGAGIRVVDDS